MDEIRFDERVAIVTGAAHGLGREYARLLAARGAKVVVNDYGGDTVGRGRSEAPAEAAAAEIRAAGGEAIANAGSVAESADGAALVEQALDQWGRLDIVVHNAGIGGGTGPFEDLSDERMDAVFRTHLYGAIHVLRPAWRAMKAAGYGRVVNTSSSTALGVDGSFDYPAAKAGLLGLTRSLARELGSRGVTVNAVAPGFIETDMTDALADDVKAELLARIPLGSFGTVEDVARTVRFLASDAARYITGQVLGVNGGLD